MAVFIRAERRIDMDHRILRMCIGVVEIIAAHIERVAVDGFVAHGQLQRPGLGKALPAVHGRVEAVLIVALRDFGDLDRGHAEQARVEYLAGAPGRAAVGGALPPVVLPCNGDRCALRRLEYPACLQIAQQVRHTGLHRVSLDCCHALLQRGDSRRIFCRRRDGQACEQAHRHRQDKQKCDPFLRCFHD